MHLMIYLLMNRNRETDDMMIASACLHVWRTIRFHKIVLKLKFNYIVTKELFLNENH